MATIGDAYMVVGGLPSPLSSGNPTIYNYNERDKIPVQNGKTGILDKSVEKLNPELMLGVMARTMYNTVEDHAMEMCLMSVAILNTVEDFVIPHLKELQLQIRIGLHSGIH